jgi:hypothetical protein
MSPTEPPPDDDFGYEGQDELYDIPTEDTPEVKTPPPPVVKKPVFPAQFGTRQQQPNRIPPSKPDMKDRGKKPIPPRQPLIISNSTLGSVGTEPALPDRSSKPTHIMHPRWPPSRKPPLPSKDSPSDDDDSRVIPSRPSLPNEETRPPIPNREFKPVMPSRETKPPMTDRESKPALPSRDTKPVMPPRDSKPVLPDRGQAPSSRENKPPLPEPSSKPPLPEPSSKPPLPELSNKPRALPASPKPHLPVRIAPPNFQDKIQAVLQPDSRSYSSDGEEQSPKESLRSLKPPLSPRLVPRKSPPPEVSYALDFISI